jgi:hypothetical protein
MRRVYQLATALLAVLLPLSVMSSPAHASSFTGAFLAKINGLRSSKGLAPLQLDPELSSFAQGWSDHLAAAGTLSHNPDLASSPGRWTKAGENVGVGADVDTLFNAFVASPHHYANLVDPDFNLIGIGVTIAADGTMWTTHDFEARPAAAPRPVAPAAPETTTPPSPAPAAPTAAPAETHRSAPPAPSPQAAAPAKQAQPAVAAASPVAPAADASAPTTELTVEPTPAPVAAVVAAASSDASAEPAAPAAAANPAKPANHASHKGLLHRIGRFVTAPLKLIP